MGWPTKPKNDEQRTEDLGSAVAPRRRRGSHVVAKCKTCGCTNQDACHHAVHGPCWWTTPEQDQCSHCAMGLVCGPRASQVSAEMETR